MDDRGTPLNQAPMINDKDVDLYKLFKVLQQIYILFKVLLLNVYVCDNLFTLVHIFFMMCSSVFL